jgi:transposase
VRSVLLYLDEKRPEEIASLLDVGLKSVYRWLNQYGDSGVDGLLEGDHPGRPPRLDVDQSAQLEDILDSGPVAYGLNTGIWTCPAIQHVIEEEFGVSFHHDHVRKLLHNLGFSVHRPGKKLALAEPELQQRWVRRTYPALKKSAAQRAE